MVVGLRRSSVRSLRAAWAAIACAIVGAYASDALAENTTVVLLSPEGPNPRVEETVTRARAELAAQGFDVVVAARHGADTRHSLEAAIAESGAIAAISIEAEPGSPVAEVWVSDRLTGKLVIRPVSANGSDDSPSLLAIRSVELLRASLIELSNPPADKKPDPIPTPVEHIIEPTQPPPPPSGSIRRGFAIELGAAGWLSFDPVTPFVAPLLRLSYGTREGFGGRVTWMGPSFGPGFDGKLGSASLMTELAIAEFVYAPQLAGPVGLVTSAGVGMYHVSASGELHDRSIERSGGATSFIAMLGAGADFRIVNHFALGIEAFVGVAAPRIAVDMGDEDVGTLGRPLAGLTLTGVGVF